MKIENGEISNSQLLTLVFSFLQASVLTVNFTFSLTKQGTWLAVLAGFAASIPFLLVFTAISRSFPGKNLVEINDLVYGPLLGKLFSVFYLWFFFQLIIHYMYFFNSFWVTYIMPETPRAAFILMFTLVCAMAVWKGLEVIARCSFLFSITVVITSVVIAVLLIGNMKISNLLPTLSFSGGEFLHSTLVVVIIGFCDLVTFLMILPYTEDKRKIRKPVLLGAFFCVIQLLIVVFRGILVMGPRILNTNSVSFAVARMIDIADVLTRLDILVAIAQLVTVFSKVTIFYYVTVSSAAQILKLRSYNHLIVPIGALSAVIAANLYPSDMEQVYAGTYIWPFNAAVYELLLPVITLIVIAVKKLIKKSEKLRAPSESGGF
ncbi:hypothetical protein SDC9_54654 [bioreactor metagenome]|uniref:Spore germination protein YndE n=1 Tax=bioreactor metagenome TaxID=1076179 RepID=A0A644WWZ5_9ZZZZ